MIATIAVIAAIADKKKKVQRSYGNHFPAIAATTITEIGLFLPQRSLWLRSLLSLNFFFLSDRSDHMETTFQRSQRQ